MVVGGSRLIGCFLYVAVMCPLYYYHQQHPVNLILLGLFTVAISLTVGLSCALTNGMSLATLV